MVFSSTLSNTPRGSKSGSDLASIAIGAAVERTVIPLGPLGRSSGLALTLFASRIVLVKHADRDVPDRTDAYEFMVLDHSLDRSVQQPPAHQIDELIALALALLESILSPEKVRADFGSADEGRAAALGVLRRLKPVLV